MDLYKHQVQYYETDKMGITHHSNYIRWMEEARIDFLLQIGLPYDKLEEMGIASPVIGIECKYKTPTTFADTVSVAVQIAEFNGVRLKIQYQMTKDENTVVCEGFSEHCFLNKDGRAIILKREFPDVYKCLSEQMK